MVVESASLDTCLTDGLMHHRLPEWTNRMDDLDMKRVAAKKLAESSKMIKLQLKTLMLEIECWRQLAHHANINDADHS